MDSVRRRIEAARGLIKSELVLKNVWIINVFTQEIEHGDIAVHEGKIVGIGEYEGETNIDCTGLYAAPGMIDSHVHIESSMVTPSNLSSVLLKRGVTAIIADPHEIANVFGTGGIEFMLRDAEESLIDIYFMLPSCVPAVPFEDNGATLNAEKLLRFKGNPRILGLGEVMDVNSVLSGNGDMLTKLREFQDYIIDGHSPNLSGKELNGYISAFVKTDHECSVPDEAMEKIRKGMYVLIREGSAAKNLEALLPAVNDTDYHRFLFCTDDRHADDLMQEGSIDYVVRKAVECGLDPVRALTIASYNAAVCYGLSRTGALAPGYNADIILFDDLRKINMRYVIKGGKLYDITTKRIELISDGNSEAGEDFLKFNSMNISPVDHLQFEIKSEGPHVNVIEIEPRSLITRKREYLYKEEKGMVKKVEANDVIKIAVFERHKKSGKHFTGFIKGFNLKDCSIAQSIAHDSHNIVVIGDSDQDMALAVNHVIASGGGITITSKGEVKASINLPIGGLMSSMPLEDTAENVRKLREKVSEYSTKVDFDIFLTLSFMSLAVIPEIKITPRGLFDYNKFKFIGLFE